MTDKDKQAIGFVDRFFPRFHILQLKGFEFLRPDHLGHDGIQNEVDPGVLMRPLLQDRAGTKLLAAVNDSHR